jgi:hypothetical protein
MLPDCTSVVLCCVGTDVRLASVDTWPGQDSNWNPWSADGNRSLIKDDTNGV